MTTMVDWEIDEAIAQGAIVIDPFHTQQLGSNSYDVRLGTHIWRRCLQKHIQTTNPTKGIISTSQNEHSEYVVELGPQMYLNMYEQCDEQIYLGPNERVLAHTEEFIGGTVDKKRTYAVVAHMHAKSSTGRYGITTNLCAGFGDVGYINRWTMEIANLDPVGKFLPVGMLIAQIEFSRVAVPRKIYGTDHGYYQAGADVVVVREAWRPEMLLPKPLKIS